MVHSLQSIHHDLTYPPPFCYSVRQCLAVQCTMFMLLSLLIVCSRTPALQLEKITFD